MRFEHDDKRPFAPDQGLRHIETFFREQVVQVVAGDAAGNVGIALADLVGVAVAELTQLGVQPSGGPSVTDRAIELLVVADASDHQPIAVVGQDFERLDVVDCLAADERMGAARVVADHSAEGVVRVRGRVRSPRQMIAPGVMPELIADDAGLDPRGVPQRVVLEDRVKVFGKVDHDRHVTGLACQ